MKHHHRGLLAVATVTAALAVPVLLATPAQAEEPEIGTEELVASLNEQAVVEVTTTITGYVYDDHLGVYVFDPASEDSAVEISTTVTCNGYVAASDGLVVTGSSCVDRALATELLELEAYYVALDNGWLDAAYPGDADEEPDYFTQDFVARSVDTYGNVRNRPMLSTEVAFTGEVPVVDGPLPAEVVTARDVAEGGLALLRIDADDLPAVEFATESPAEGSTYATIGAESGEGPFTPTVRTGTIGAEMTAGVYADRRLTTSSSYDYDGAPVFDEQGYLIGTLLPDENDGDALTALERTEELLAGAGAENSLDETTQAFHDGVRAYAAGDREAAIRSLEEVLEAQPDHAAAQDFLARAEELPEPADDSTGSDGASDSALRWVFVGLVAAGALLAVVCVVLTVRARRRSRPVFTPQPYLQHYEHQRF